MDPAAAGVRPARGDRGPDPGASRWVGGASGLLAPTGLLGLLGLLASAGSAESEGLAGLW